MVDLHTHLLPGIDDGAATVTETYQLIESLRKQSVTTAACTPHYNPAEISLTEFLENRTRSLNSLQEAKINLLTGSEVALNEYLFHYTDLSPLCIGPTRYILIELPFDRSFKEEVFVWLERLLNYYNVVPIIAHIEKYPAAKRKKTILKLKQLGCVIQMNASSIVQKKTRKRALNLVKKGFIEIIASDCHNLTKRPPELGAAYEILKLKFGINYVQQLIKNGDIIIEDIPLKDKSEYLFE
jgi:protein-tyrosine phosphatase